MTMETGKIAEGKGEALLLGLGLSQEEVGSFAQDPQGTVEAGLQYWVDNKNPTCKALLNAMQSAGFADSEAKDHCKKIEEWLWVYSGNSVFWLT